MKSHFLKWLSVYRVTMNILGNRLNDWRHERFIQYLRSQFRASYEAGDKARARHLWACLAEAIHSRSQAQAARIEKALHRRLGML